MIKKLERNTPNLYDKTSVGSMGLKKTHLLRVPIDRNLFADIQKSITILQESGLIEVSVSSFCRQALKSHTSKCINERMGIVFEPNVKSKKDKVRIYDEEEDEENKRSY
jgi:hypothetical protein